MLSTVSLLMSYLIIEGCGDFLPRLELFKALFLARAVILNFYNRVSSHQEMEKVTGFCCHCKDKVELCVG